MAFDKLIFEEHFDGDTINRDVWDYEIGFIRNHEPQYYTDRPCNAYVEDSMLHIVTRRENYEGARYTSASLNTLGKFSFRYGRIEMRAKLPWSRGLWPAFWMMGDNFPVVDWPHCGEIDIMEIFCTREEYTNGKLTMSLHWQSGEKDNHDRIIRSYQLPEGKFADDFHTYGLEWEEDELRWCFDGDVKLTVPITEDMKGCFNKPHFVLINTALCDHNEERRPTEEDTVLPQDFIIDYIRVYQ